MEVWQRPGSSLGSKGTRIDAYPSVAKVDALINLLPCPLLQGNVLLLSMQNRFGIVALHFTAAIPRLDAHLLPLEMPKQLEEVGDDIVAMAWDRRGERLVVALNTGILAILSTKWSPLLSVSLVGMISGPRSRYA